MNLATIAAAALFGIVGCTGPTRAPSVVHAPSAVQPPKVCGVVLVHTTGGMPSPQPGWKPVDRRQPLAGATLELRGFKGDDVPLDDATSSITTDEEGHFCLPGPPGTYVVLVTASERSNVFRSTFTFGGKPVPAIAQVAIALDDGDVRGLLLEVSEVLPQ